MNVRNFISFSAEQKEPRKEDGEISADDAADKSDDEPVVKVGLWEDEEEEEKKAKKKKKKDRESESRVMSGDEEHEVERTPVRDKPDAMGVQERHEAESDARSHIPSTVMPKAGNDISNFVISVNFE